METPITARAAILWALADGGAGFGGELAARVLARTGLQLADGSLYPAIASLSEAKLVRERRGGKGRRRVFELSAAGTKASAAARRVFALLAEGPAAAPVVSAPPPAPVPRAAPKASKPAAPPSRPAKPIAAPAPKSTEKAHRRAATGKRGLTVPPLVDTGKLRGSIGDGPLLIEPFTAQTFAPAPRRSTVLDRIDPESAAPELEPGPVVDELPEAARVVELDETTAIAAEGEGAESSSASRWVEPEAG